MRKATAASLLLVASWLATRDARAQPPPAATPMQAGGLAPPAPGTGPAPPPPAQPSTTQSQLERADAEDAGRGLEFAFVAIEGGGAYVGLGGRDELVAGQARGFGPAFGAQVGGRLLYWTAGPRFRWIKLSNLSLWTLNLDLGWRFPLGKLEPHAMLGGGYARANGTGSDARIDGFDVRLGGGIDYYVTNVFSIGGAVSADLVRVTRAATNAAPLGFAVTATAVAALHF